MFFRRRASRRIGAFPKDRALTESPTEDAFDGKDRLLKEVFRLLKRYSKVDFVDYKVATIRRRILRRMHINRFSRLGDYVKFLHRNPQEIEALYRDVLINVTSFFRNPEVFDSLREVVYPKLLADRSSSDPCAFGCPDVPPEKKLTLTPSRW